MLFCPKFSMISAAENPLLCFPSTLQNLFDKRAIWCMMHARKRTVRPAPS